MSEIQHYGISSGGASHMEDMNFYEIIGMIKALELLKKITSDDYDTLFKSINRQIGIEMDMQSLGM